MLELNNQFADSKTTIQVLRDGTLLDPMPVEPKTRNGKAQIGMAPSLDIAHAVVAQVRKGSPAEKAGVKPGARLQAVNATPVRTWIDVFNAVRTAQAAGKEVTLALDGAPEPVSLGMISRESFDPEAYTLSVFDTGYAFEPLMVEIVKRNPLAAMAWGAEKTWDFLVVTYASLRGLMRGTVSTKQIHGPVGIGDMAIRVGRRGIVDFMFFLAIISVTLAVMNFLPIPVVDGGHAVFLIIEKVRGKPVPMKIQNVVQMVGLALLLGVFVLVTWQDIARLIRGLW
jgi:regulator of sigma E protease